MVPSSSLTGQGRSSAAPEPPATKRRGPVDMDDEYAATHNMHDDGAMIGNTIILCRFLAIVYGHIKVISLNAFQAFRIPSGLYHFHTSKHNKHGGGMIGNTILLLRFLAKVFGYIKVISHALFQAFRRPGRLYHFHTSKEIPGNQPRTKDDSRVLTLDDAAGSSITGGAAQPADAPRFILDSGATVHATGNRALLSRFTRIPADSGYAIRVANGDPVPIRGIGSVVTPGSIALHDVLFVPGLAKNIVSVSRLTKLDYRVNFTGTGFSVRDAGTGELVGHGRLLAGLFEIDFLQVPLGRSPPV